MAPGAALTACIHNQVRKARAAPGEPVNSKASAAAITRILHHAGQRSSALSWQKQPAFNGLPAIAIEGYIKHLNRAQIRLNWHKTRVQWMLAHSRQRLLPENIKICRLMAQWQIVLEFIQG